MGIYGYGKAFNLRYAHNTYKPTIRYGRAPQRPIMSSTVVSNTNINIKSGGNFWTGLFSGLLGGGLFSGGLFGGGMNMGFGMGNFGMGGFSPFGFLNTQMNAGIQPKTGDRLADLQKMYPDWNITSDGNGKYDAVNKDQTIHHSGNFDEMCQKLLKEKQGAGTTPGSSAPAGSTPEESTPESSTPQGTTPEKSKPEGAGSSGGAGGASHAHEPQGAGGASHAHEPQGAGHAGSRVHVPNGWYRADTQSNEGKNLQLNKCTSANAVLEKLLSAKMDYLSNTDRAALCKELIKYNPSVFNADGTVKQNANFDNLDVPSIDYIKNKYVQKGSIKRNGARTSYTAKSTGEQTETKVSNTQAAAKANKTKAYTATITFNIHTMGLNQGSGEARFTDSTGQTHTFTASTGASWNATNARKDIAAQIREKIKAAGFTNVTLKNPSNYEF